MAVTTSSRASAAARLGVVVVCALALSSIIMVSEMLFIQPSPHQLVGHVANGFLSPASTASATYAALPASSGMPSMAMMGLAVSGVLALVGRAKRVGRTARQAAAASTPASKSARRKSSRDVSQPGDDYDAPKELDDESVDEVMNGATPTLDSVHSPDDIRKMSIPQLKDLCDDTRRFLVRSVSQTGGHLGSNLGVVELTAALHNVFNTPYDKLLSGMSAIRQGGGLSGFTKRTESPYDPFGAGHSGTAMSAATGFAMARDHKKRVHDEAVQEGQQGVPPLSPEDDYTVVSVVGDGAITGGMAYEAMNHAGWLKLRKFLVILNDNGQVSLPTAYNEVHTPVLSSPSFQDARNTLKLAVKALCPPQLADSLGRIEEYGRGLLSSYSRGTMFEELGFYYVGPVDGHNLDTLVTVLKNLKQSMDEGKITKPVLLHVKTEKGHGYKPAEVALDKLHGVTQFDVKTGKKEAPKKAVKEVKPEPAAAEAPKKMAYTDVFAKALIAAAERDSRIVAITAAMPGGTGLHHFEKRFGLDRMFDVGICEQHAVTMAAGMAAEGLVPYAAIYSSFMQRAIDQMVHDVALQKLPVRFVLDRAGFVGADGPTHHGQFDLAMLGCVPDMKICAPGDEAELSNMIYTMSKLDDGPSAVRFPRGSGEGVPIPVVPEFLEPGKGRVVKVISARGVGIIIGVLVSQDLGARLSECKKAAQALSEKYGHHVTVADARWMKPLDESMICALAKGHDVMVTVEEGSIGGFGSHVLELLADKGLLGDGKLQVGTIHIPDKWYQADTPENQLEKAGITPEAIVQKHNHDITAASGRAEDQGIGSVGRGALRGALPERLTVRLVDAPLELCRIVLAPIVKVGEEKKKIPGNLKGLSIGLEEDIVPHKQVMQDTVMECVTYLPQKTSVYAAWLGLLVRPHRVFVTELVDRAAELLGDCSSVLAMKILMRFLVELANCRCVLFDSVLAVIQELVELRNSEEVHNKEMPVYAALHGLLVISSALYKDNKEAVDAIIGIAEEMKKGRAERRSKLASCVAASSEFVQEDDFDRLVGAVVSMRDQVWRAEESKESPVLLRPYEMAGLAPKLAVESTRAHAGSADY
ncbi:hypothetical protein FOZ60_015192 [Perkinsus olseni]|uniref:1-deoxy-D-xylulose-5-phosphate synthase n=1 Tax=Perkinsus olseni TaxID=32597 RepID=A0A7J6P6E7_PEROL|nr:hypothetical protein FOZ60_015192 [Perkinsus olseni]